MKSTDLKSGHLIEGRFRLTKVLGKGGFGAVWAAHDLVSDQTVALKLLHTKLLGSSWVLDRFSLEIDILRQLKHPRIARCLHAGEENGMAYMCMELVQGESLQELLAYRSHLAQPTSFDDAVVIVDQLSSALAYAHDKGIIHRDLKPKNIMIARIDDLSQVKLLDFGIAKVLYDTAQDATTVGRLLGSLLYLSPEQALSEAISPRADIFALGSITFELLTGRRTWAWDPTNNPLKITRSGIAQDDINNHLSILKRIVDGPRPIAHRFRPDIPSAVSQVLIKAMATDPQDRYGTSTEFITALKSGLASKLQTSTPTDLLEEESLTHVVPSSRPGPQTEQPVIPQDPDHKDDLTTRYSRAKPNEASQSTAPLPLATPATQAPYQPINVRTKKSIPQSVVLLFGLLAGMALTYAFFVPRQAQLPPAATPAKPPPAQTPKPITAINKPEKQTPPAAKSETANPTAPKRSPKRRTSQRKQTEATQASKTVPAPSTKLQRAWKNYLASPNDLERMDTFAEQFRTEIKAKLSSQTQTSLLRCVKLAELRASLELFESCLNDYKEARN